MNCWGTSINSLSLSDMLTEVERWSGEEGKVLVKERGVWQNVVDVLVIPVHVMI